MLNHPGPFLLPNMQLCDVGAAVCFPSSLPLSLFVCSGVYYHCVFSHPVFLLAPSLFILPDPSRALSLFLLVFTYHRLPPSSRRQYCSVRAPVLCDLALGLLPSFLCACVSRDVSPFFRVVPGAISVQCRTICLPAVKKRPRALAVPPPASESAFVATHAGARPSFSLACAPLPPRCVTPFDAAAAPGDKPPPPWLAVEPRRS